MQLQHRAPWWLWEGVDVSTGIQATPVATHPTKPQLGEPRTVSSMSAQCQPFQLLPHHLFLVPCAPSEEEGRIAGVGASRWGCSSSSRPLLTACLGSSWPTWTCVSCLGNSAFLLLVFSHSVASDFLLGHSCHQTFYVTASLPNPISQCQRSRRVLICVSEWMFFQVNNEAKGEGVHSFESQWMGSREVRKTGQKAAGCRAGTGQRLERLGLWVSALSAWEVCCLPPQRRGLRRSSGWSGHMFKEGGPLPASQLPGQALDSEWMWHWSPLFGGGIIPSIKQLFYAQHPE